VARDDGDDKRLVAYVVPAEGAAAFVAASAATLRQALGQELPSAMVPSGIVTIDALPRTPSGKVDRRALPAFEVTAQSPFVAPRTPVEEVLATIWSRLLDVPRVGVYDDFFADLAGHSLLAARLVARVRDLFQVELALRTLFESPTVAGMAASLHAADAGRGQVEKVARTWLALDRLSDTEVDVMLSAERTG
jgi:hypothetical protein